MTDFEVTAMLVSMIHKNLSNIPERVKHARKEAGFKNQSLIAEEMGVTRDAYARYETSVTMPTEKIPKFCQITGVDPEWLLTGRGSMTKEEGPLDNVLALEKNEIINQSDELMGMLGIIKNALEKSEKDN